MNRPPRRQADGQRALRHLHGVLILDGDDAGGHLDVVDLAQRHRKNREKVWLVGHLAHPQPAKALVAQLGEVAARRRRPDWNCPHRRVGRT